MDRIKRKITQLTYIQHIILWFMGKREALFGRGTNDLKLSFSGNELCEPMR